MRRLRFRLLLGLVVLHVVVLGAELPAPWTDVTNLVTVPLYAGLIGWIRGRRDEAIATAVLLAIAPIMNLVVPWSASGWVDVVKIVFWTIAPAWIVWRVFVTIYDADQVTHEEIFGAIALYVLVGLVFANVYEGLFLLDNDVLRFGDNFPASTVGFGEVLYFSYVTLASLGYGDISPNHASTRIVAVIESIVGLMYMAILLARFVSLHTRDPRRS